RPRSAVAPGGFAAPAALRATGYARPLAPLPRPRGPHAARGRARGRRSARRRARESFADADEPEAVALVARLPARAFELLAKPVRFRELAGGARRLTPLGELEDVRRRFLRSRERLEPEDRERAPQHVVVSTFVHDRERGGRVEVVVERGGEP